MPTRLLLITILALLTSSCGGGDKRFPSSNPPEYDPNKVYSAPASQPTQPAASPVKPAEPELPPVQLPSLEPGPNEKGEWKKVPVNPESLQLFKGVKNTCEALSKIVQGLGSAQLFAGAEGQALKKSLGSQVELFAQSMDQQLFDTFKQQLGPRAADCSSPALPRKSGLDDTLQLHRLVLASGPSHGSFNSRRPRAREAKETRPEHSRHLERPRRR